MLPTSAELPERLRVAAQAAGSVSLREPRPSGFPLFFTDSMQIIEPVVAFIMPTIHPDRTPDAAGRLSKALALLKRRNSADAARQGPTISELCRLAGVSRNAIYRYHPTVLATLRGLQDRPADPPGQWARSAHAADHARLQDQLFRLAALVDHYCAACRETRALLDGRDRQLAELRRKFNRAPVAIR